MSAKIKLPRKMRNDEDKLDKEAAKAAKKAAKEAEKTTKKAELELNKALKKGANEAKKNETPGTAIKFLVIKFPETIISKYAGLPALLEVAGINYETVACPIIDNLIEFRRDLTFKTLGDNMEMHDVVNSTEEDQVILLLYPDEVIPKISAQLSHSPNCLISYVQELQSLFIDKKLTLFFMELDKYFKKQKKNAQQDFRNRVLNGDGDDIAQPSKRKNKKAATLPLISEMELHSSLVELQLSTNVNYRIVKDVQELGLHVIQYAKAVADAPYKRRKMQFGFDWFDDTPGSIKVDKEGVGLKSLWIDQLMQFNNVGIDTAQAIAAAYPSPLKLMEAYNRCSTLNEGLLLLKDLPVRVGIGPLTKTRKVGPELSKKMYRFFTCNDGERSLSHSQDI